MQKIFIKNFFLATGLSASLWAGAQTPTAPQPSPAATSPSATAPAEKKPKTPHFSLVMIKQYDACKKAKGDEKTCLAEVQKRCETELTAAQCGQFIHYLQHRQANAPGKE